MAKLEPDNASRYRKMFDLLRQGDPAVQPPNAFRNGAVAARYLEREEAALFVARGVASLKGARGSECGNAPKGSAFSLRRFRTSDH
ncbi:hypothetical protein HKX54_04585 [Sulfitobacter sp. M57]|uniref:hypothetical protein n=1 Tax=unclassified Sulfitobacter TaxID=196795 RepID=UPI0023E25EF2|nr:MULTISPECIES: hypothetical protein [unclassified Sulfitobacter]MDF3413725.1 hypothetical protein [Sulfitobacter sp. KE5]MDF3420994.1 hypothetical protein [Sulfitobacter sp. KE43]MDF3432271.1 hypothetical protein [Sulfitobacter sp. KE42]MDF3457910.1 hypothetical protein [Sulfitobacter sp. S74]MDF3461811.1 hypothetical protein [Sulfitobacter sp. Ks18]